MWISTSTAASTKSRSFLMEESDLILSRFLWLGQGQRYIEEADLNSFKKLTLKLNSQFPDSETLPGLIVSTVPLKNRISHPYYARDETWAEIDWTDGTCKFLLNN